MNQDLGTQIADELAAKNFAVIPRAISPDLVSRLRECANERRADFKIARVGRDAQVTQNPLIRNDEIFWLEPSDLRAPELELFTVFETVKSSLNRELFLGLDDFEAHYARYDVGHFYHRHVDRFQSAASTAPAKLQRVVSIVLYLNENWTDADGGRLRLHMTPPVEISPDGGTVVAFMSSEIEHEVLTSNRGRLSIAAWFRRIE